MPKQKVSKYSIRYLIENTDATYNLKEVVSNLDDLRLFACQLLELGIKFLEDYLCANELMLDCLCLK